MAIPFMTDTTQPPPQYKLALLNALQGGASPGGFAPVNAQTGASIGSTTEPGKVDGGGPVPPTGNGSGGSGSNVDRFMSLLNSGQYGSTQDAINAFNGLGLNGDSTGLSSNYGSSPAAYENGNVIGLPDRVLRKNADGTWTTEMRGPSAPSGGGGAGMVGLPGIGGGLNAMLQGNAGANITNALQNIGAMTNGNGYLQSLIAALNGGGK